MKTIEIKTQKQFDKIKDDFDGEIRIVGALDRINRSFKNAWINICDSATVNNIYGSATVNNICGSATVKYIYDSATVNNICDSATVNNICDSAKILLAAGLASILMVSGQASVKTMGNNIVRNSISEKNITLDLSKNTTHIILKDDNKDIDWFCGNYPVERNKSKITLYKAVRKNGDEYYSSYDSNFKYVIGKTATEKCDPDVTEECSYGIHISHLRWAVIFGSQWDDMAILECKVNTKDIIVPENTDGKIRASQVKIVREVPESEY